MGDKNKFTILNTNKRPQGLNRKKEIITRKEFEQWNAFRTNTHKQDMVLNLLRDNSDEAFTLKEITRRIFGEEYTISKRGKVYRLLFSLKRKGLIETRSPYYIYKILKTEQKR